MSKLGLLLPDFLQTSKMRDDIFSYLQILQEIRNLCKKKAIVKIESNCSLLCSMCTEEITDEQYFANEFMNGSCLCKKHNHISCFRNKVLSLESEFESIEKVLDLINSEFSCNNKQCQQDGIQQFTRKQLELFDENELINFIQSYEEKKIQQEEEERIKEKKQKSFDCNICICDYQDITENGYEFECGHTFCNSCLCGHFKHEISQPGAQLNNKTCPEVGCQQKVEYLQILDILRREKTDTERLEMIHIKETLKELKQANLDSNDRLITCPGMYIQSKTDGSIRLIEQELLTKKLQGKEADLQLQPDEEMKMCTEIVIKECIPGKHRHRCKKCRYDFCINKCDDNHPDSTCEKYQEFKLESNKDYRKELEALGLRFCPNCSVITERIDGCNRITCTNCKKSYCYKCYFLANTATEVYTHLTAVHGGYWT